MEIEGTDFKSRNPSKGLGEDALSQSKIHILQNLVNLESLNVFLYFKQYIFKKTLIDN